MSEVNASDTRLIESAHDVLGTYQGVGEASKAGVEVELAFFDPSDPNLAPMNVAQNKIVKAAANAQMGEEFARNEPTSEMLEVGSIAAAPGNLRSVMDDTNAKIQCLVQQAQKTGLKRSYFQHLPDKTANQLLENLMDVERYQAFFGPPRDDMKAVAAYFSVCKSNQVSVSYRNTAHMLENVRRLYTLAPFLFMITDNAAPFNEGQPFTGHAGMYHRAALGKRGGIPPYVFTATNGDEYIAAHIDHAMNNPLFVYYDEKGKLIRLPSGTFTSFNQLRDQGLNTATNYYFSESILWPDVKIAALKNENGEVVDHRYEARMIGVGAYQHQSAFLAIAALAYDDEFAQKIDNILSLQGLDQTDLPNLKSALPNAYSQALNHNQKFLDIAYGQKSMQDFATAFADALEASDFINSFADEIAPLLYICRTGETDSRINARFFNTLDKATTFQRTYDSAIFDNPNLCAAQILNDKSARNLKTA